MYRIYPCQAYIYNSHLSHNSLFGIHADSCNFGLCGSRAQCFSSNSTDGLFDCACFPGFTGDPFSRCNGKTSLNMPHVSSSCMWLFNLFNNFHIQISMNVRLSLTTAVAVAVAMAVMIPWDLVV